MAKRKKYVCFKSRAAKLGVKDREMKTEWWALKGERQYNKYLKEQLKSRRPEEPQTTGQSRSEWNGEREGKHIHTYRKYKTRETNTERTYMMCRGKKNLNGWGCTKKWTYTAIHLLTNNTSYQINNKYNMSTSPALSLDFLYPLWERNKWTPSEQSSLFYIILLYCIDISKSSNVTATSGNFVFILLR